ncbi:hypothetical protein Tco_1003828 [Tanacetum coccineum]|uniref:Uncharacterized protein n=1 Tax=Tanacetum coccineum TaxID=301880 RepID=A0ABQ5FAF7_9ASTR
MYFKYSTGLIPLKKGRGKEAKEGKKTVTPQKPTKPKKKPSKKKQHSLKLTLRKQLTHQANEEAHKQAYSAEFNSQHQIGKTVRDERKRKDGGDTMDGSAVDGNVKVYISKKTQEPFHAVKVFVIPETTQQPPFTPPAPPLPATEIQSTQVPNTEAVKSVVERFTKLEQAVKELKQADHSTAILALIRSQELSEKKDYKDIIEEYVQANVINEVKNFQPNFLPHVVKEAHEKTPPSLGDKPDTSLKKRDRGDDQDDDPSAGSNQDKKTKKRRVNESDGIK